MTTIVSDTRTHLTRGERQLLRAAFQHLRQTDWSLYSGGGHNRGARLAADWDGTVVVDNKPHRVLSVRCTTPHGSTQAIALEALVDTVQEAVDFGAAIGLLPMGLSSLYQAGLETTHYTAQLSLSAHSIERAYMVCGEPLGWQILDARDETTWHDITGVVAECGSPDCVIDDIPGLECVVVLSTAWAAGAAHLESDELLTVRIPADRMEG